MIYAFHEPAHGSFCEEQQARQRCCGARASSGCLYVPTLYLIAVVLSFAAAPVVMGGRRLLACGTRRLSCIVLGSFRQVDGEVGDYLGQCRWEQIPQAVTSCETRLDL